MTKKTNLLLCLLLPAVVVTAAACGDDDDSAGTAGSAGSVAGFNNGGTAGTTSTGGKSGTAGTGGKSGAAGSTAGTAGTAGTSGKGGAGGTTGGAGGTTGGAGGTTGGTAGTTSTGGKGGAAGTTGGTGTEGGSAGAGGTAGTTGGTAGTTGGGAGTEGGSAGTTGGTAGTTGGTGGTDGGAGGTTGGAGGTTGGAGGTTGGSGGAAANPKSGFVTFGVYGAFAAGLSTFYSNAASAAFQDAGGPPSSGNSCTISDEGGCQLIVCDLVPGGGGDVGGAAGAPAAPNAGDITLTGGQITPVVLSFADGSYKVTTPAPTIPGGGLPNDKAAFNGGEAINVKAAGGTVPAFTLDAEAPVSPTVTGLPAGTLGMPTDIDTSKDLTLTLAGGAKGNVQFSASASTSAKFTGLLCTVAASASSLTAPATGLQKLKAVSDKGTYAAVLSSTVAGKAGDWDVTLSLPNYLKGSDGKALTASGQANFK